MGEKAKKTVPPDKMIRMYGPILDVLRERGGEGPAREIMRVVADRVIIDPDERNEELASGGNKVENEVAWARNSLRVAGLLDGSTRGVWRLTPKGEITFLTTESARMVGIPGGALTENQLPESAQQVPGEIGIVDLEVVDSHTAPELEDSRWEDLLIDTLLELSPTGFEKFCRTLLTKLGFENVEVTPASGDGGIDGFGTYRINELLSIQVVFQCKRYKDSVGAPDIQNFKGSMLGKSKDGIFITTGRFTTPARKEAVSVQDMRIALVDRDKLVELLKNHELGVKPRIVYEVDRNFFEPFQNKNPQNQS